MKEIFIGIGKACYYIVTLVLMFWALTGFKTPTQIDIASVLAVGAIVRHFIDKEQLKSLKEVIDVGHFTSYPNALEILYEQLKKLREE